VNSRIFLLAITIFLFTAALIARLFSLQVLSHDSFKALATSQHQLYRTLVPQRGQIFVLENKDGRIVPAVTNVEKNLVFAQPHEIENKPAAATQLSQILQMPAREILEKIDDNSRKWVILKKELPESEALAVAALKLKGIGLESESFRFYPEKVFASQLLGFYAYEGEERAGQYGIEEHYDELLAGRPGSLALEKDIRGAWITGGERQFEAAVDGVDIELTLDRAIQYQAETILKNAVEQYEADDGSMVVMDPATGKILAMANFPTFDPNLFNKVEDISVYRNRAVTDAYEPGSVFKPITMAAGLDSGSVQPDMIFEDTGFMKFDKFTIKNANDKIYGAQNMTQVLEQSINTGAIFVQQKTGKDKFLEIVKRFGFGQKTGLTIPGEAAGDMRNLEKSSDIHYATASFGQGLTTTLVQLASAYSTIANSGKMMKPYLVQKIDYKDGRVDEIQPLEIRQVISSKAAHTLGAMLVNVVENGHGKRAGVPGYYVGGKTGTAQIAKTDGPGYDEDRTIGSFIGFGPVDNPKFVIAVKITNPKAVRSAESSAAPTFGEMARYLVNYYQIPPSR